MIIRIEYEFSGKTAENGSKTFDNNDYFVGWLEAVQDCIKILNFEIKEK